MSASAPWSPTSWRALPAAQQPDWPDPAEVTAAADRLRRLPPLVFAGEARALLAALADVAEGRAFLLQAGDCVESFHDLSAVQIREKLKVVLQMAAVLTHGALLPVVKVVRMAGQYVKPRSAPLEKVNGVSLLTFRGHMVHDDAPQAEARLPRPERMLQAYYSSSSTLNLLRAFTKGGFADLGRVHQWNQEFVRTSCEGRRYQVIADEIDRAIRFVAACGVDAARTPQLREVDVWTSHEGLLLEYEEALARLCSITSRWYACSAHMLWIGDRTRQLDGAHVEFFRGVGNPIGVKLGPTVTPADTVRLCEQLNPGRAPGRLTLITRLGATRVRELLPPLLAAVRDAGHVVVWVCDPMHANTQVTAGGRKTRAFDDILAEVEGFFAAHRDEGTWPGGVHLEITGEDVTECLGGAEEVRAGDLDRAYLTLCDPRLNARQSLDLAFQIAEWMRSRGLPPAAASGGPAPADVDVR